MHQVIQDQMEHLLKKRNSCRKLSSKKKKKTTTREVLADQVSWNFPSKRDESEVKKQQAIQDQLRKNRKNMKKKKKKTILEEEEVVDDHMSWIPWPEQQDNQFSSISQLEQDNHQGDSEVSWISQPEQDNRIDNHQQDNQASWITLPEQVILPPSEWTNPLPECKKCAPLPPEWTIEVGKRYEVSRFLSGKTRDYLVKRDGDKVKIDDCISGKHVILYFWWLSDDGLTADTVDYDLNLDLKETYSTYNPQGKFEVVFVALGNNEDNFLDSFSCMPWLAIPHKDKEARALVIEEFAIASSLLATPVLFAPDGTAMLKTACFNITTFGAYGFPFTERRIDEICFEARTRWDKLVLEKVKPSLTALIGEYVISPEGNHVLTSELEHKIVGLYFFEISYPERTRKLLEIWKLLKDRQRKDFEILFINKENLSMAKAGFEEEFGSIPWYLLPFDGRWLCEVFRNNEHRWDINFINSGHFIILEPDRYQSFNYFGFEILEELGIDACPFTLEKAAILEMSKQQHKLVLGELLSPSAPLVRGGSAGYQEMTIVSKMSGKRVLLLFATHLCYEAGSFMRELKQIYLENKGAAYGDFEIIYITLDCDEAPCNFSMGIKGMPWLVHSFVPDFGFSLAQMVFGVFPPQLPAIAAFGPSGNLENKESNLALKKKWIYNYPFIQDDMRDEVHSELIHKPLGNLFDSSNVSST